MTASKGARRANAKSSTLAIVTRSFRIPCFAHQELDHERFPQGLGSAIGGPISWFDVNSKHDGAQGTWENSDDEEGIKDTDRVEVEVVKKKTPATRRKRKAEPKVKPDSSYKRMKVPGGRPATAKKVTADLDSDDDMILRMKNARYLEKDIAQALVDQGRIAYNQKTIGTRYARMMRVILTRQDALLDAELTDWHEGDDDALKQAIAKAQNEVQRMKEQADARKWRVVAKELKQIKPVVNFSHNACRKRYEALVSGTAKPTPESISNPDKKVLKSIESRREKQKRIEEDAVLWRQGEKNLEGNAWTSRARAVEYFADAC